MENEIIIDAVECLRQECLKSKDQRDPDIISYCAERMAKEKLIETLIKGCYDASLNDVIKLLKDKYFVDQLVMESTLTDNAKTGKTPAKKCLGSKDVLLQEVKKEKESREKLLNAIFNNNTDNGVVMEDY